MENINQDTIDKIINNWGSFVTTYDKLNDLISDLNNCKSEYAKTILVNAISKLSENAGLKEKIFQ